MLKEALTQVISHSTTSLSANNKLSFKTGVIIPTQRTDKTEKMK